MHWRQIVDIQSSFTLRQSLKDHGLSGIPCLRLFEHMCRAFLWDDDHAIGITYHQIAVSHLNVVKPDRSTQGALAGRIFARAPDTDAS